MLKFSLGLVTWLSQLVATGGQMCSFVYQGCWNDSATNHLVPNQITPPFGATPYRWTSVWECTQVAAALGYDTVALQNGGICFGGVNSSYGALGRATSCAPLGGANSSQIFQLMPRGCSQSCSWTYKGCFNDATSRRIPMQLAVLIGSAQACMRLAAAGGYDTIGVQAWGYCFAGVNSVYRDLGPASGCPALGGSYTNQVYQLSPPGCSICSWVFKGCFLDNSSHVVPNLLSSSIASAADCEALAEVGSYDTYALQGGSQCWAGQNPPFAALGFGTSSQCGPLGGVQTSIVYQKTPLGCGSQTQQPIATPQTCNWEYMGCFRDNTSRLVPNQIVAPNSAPPYPWVSEWDCMQAAAALGYDTAALQYGGVCFGGVNSPYDALGRATACSLGSSPLGGSYTSQIFRLTPRGCTPPCMWAYKGCFLDSSTRQIPNQLASVSSIQGCTRLAEAGGYDTVGVQFGSACFAGVQPMFYALGPVTGCAAMGNSYTNQVYQLTPQGCSICSWVYRGCWADNSSQLVPNLLSSSVSSATLCESLAEINGYDTVALQGGGLCFGGVSPRYDAIGPGTACSNPLGGTLSNMVYAKFPLNCGSGSQTPSQSPSGSGTRTGSGTQSSSTAGTSSGTSSGTGSVAASTTQPASRTSTPTPTFTTTATMTASLTNSASMTTSATQTPSTTQAATPSRSPTSTSTQSITPTLSATQTQSVSASSTPSGAATVTSSASVSQTRTVSATQASSLTSSQVPTTSQAASTSATLSASSTGTSSQGATASQTLSIGSSHTGTCTASQTGTPSMTPVHSQLLSLSSSATGTRSGSQMSPPSTAIASPTAPSSFVPSLSPSIVYSLSVTSSQVATLTPGLSLAPSLTPHLSQLMCASPSAAESRSVSQLRTANAATNSVSPLDSSLPSEPPFVTRSPTASTSSCVTWAVPITLSLSGGVTAAAVTTPSVGVLARLSIACYLRIPLTSVFITGVSDSSASVSVSIDDAVDTQTGECTSLTPHSIVRELQAVRGRGSDSTVPFSPRFLGAAIGSVTNVSLVALVGACAVSTLGKSILTAQLSSLIDGLSSSSSSYASSVASVSAPQYIAFLSAAATTSGLPVGAVSVTASVGSPSVVGQSNGSGGSAPTEGRPLLVIAIAASVGVFVVLALCVLAFVLLCGRKGHCASRRPFVTSGAGVAEDAGTVTGVNPIRSARVGSGFTSVPLAVQQHRAGSVEVPTVALGTKRLIRRGSARSTEFALGTQRHASPSASPAPFSMQLNPLHGSDGVADVDKP